MKDLKNLKSIVHKIAMSAWIDHVKKVAKSQNITYKEALKVASKSYTKK